MKIVIFALIFALPTSLFALSNDNCASGEKIVEYADGGYQCAETTPPTTPAITAPTCIDSDDDGVCD